MDKRIYEFEEVDVHSESPKAYHCQIGQSLFWVPKSQIKRFDIDAGLLVTTAWWAEISGAQEAYEAEIERQEEAERLRQQKRQETTPPVTQLLKSQAIYRELALKYHPDRNPDTAEMMRDLNRLWQQVIADLKKAR